MALVRTVSWRNENDYEYVKKLANSHFNGNESAAIADCVACHKKVTSIYSDWRLIDKMPHWVSLLTDRIVERLEHIKIVSDGNKDKVRQEIERSYILDEELFE